MLETSFVDLGGRCTFIVRAYPETTHNMIVEQDFPDGTFKKKVVRVEDAPGVAFDLKKTKINAAGGSAGLVKFLSKCKLFCDFGGAWNSKIFNWIMNDMKEAKI